MLLNFIFDLAAIPPTHTVPAVPAWCLWDSRGHSRLREAAAGQFVVKEVKVGHLCPTERDLARMEIKVLRSLDHPNVVRYPPICAVMISLGPPDRLPPPPNETPGLLFGCIADQGVAYFLGDPFLDFS